MCFIGKIPRKIQLKKNRLVFVVGISWDRSAKRLLTTNPHPRPPTTGLVQLHLVIPKDLSHKIGVMAGFLSEGFTQNPRYHSEITNDKLVGGFNRFEAYESNWIISPLRVENKATI